MQFFQELIAVVQDRWQARHYDEAAFPELAKTALEEFAPASRVTPADIVRWALTATQFPVQPDLDSDFGQPPVCLASTSRVAIQALFWVDGTTSIHQHGFCGAFQVLEGSSIHATYRFDMDERINAHLLFGNVRYRDVEYLRKGATRTIIPGKQFIHALFHLDRPSVTLVLRTHHDLESGPQYNYFKPSVALNPFYREPQLVRRQQLLELLGSLTDANQRLLARDAVLGASYTDGFLMLKHCYERRMPDEQIHELIDAFERRHRGHGSLAPVFAEMTRLRYLVGKRKVARTPELRFFLALLLNIPDRQGVLRVIGEQFPGANATDLILRWTDEMAALTDGRDPGGDPLGTRLSDGEKAVFRCLLEGVAPAEVPERLKAEYEDVEQQGGEIRRLCVALSESSVYRPLWAT
jgi:hypothetical protein